MLATAVIRKPLYKCFIHMLREINPNAAKGIESTPRIRNPNQKSKTDKLNERVDKTYQRVSMFSYQLLFWHTSSNQ